MIYERSIFVFAWIVLSSLVASPGGSTESKDLKLNFVTEGGIVFSSANQIHAQDETLKARVVHLQDEEWITKYGQADLISNKQKAPYLSSTKPTLTVVQAVQNPSAKIDRRLAVVGIGVTSTVFLILLWFLFKPEPKNTLAKVTSLNKQDGLDRSNKIENSHDVVDDSELAAITLLSSTKINLAQESPNGKALEKPLKVSENQKIAFNRDTIQPSQELAKNKDSVELDSDTPGMVKIVAANTTEIDIVFELIKDLQQSDRTLRRKAIWELAQKGDSRAIEPLVEIMSEASSLGKSLILNAITQIAHRSFAPVNDVLFTSLEDKNSEVRKDAIRDLVALHESTLGVNKRLTNMLNDSDLEVRQTAKWALKRINSVSSTTTQNYINNENNNHGIASSNGTSNHS